MLTATYLHTVALLNPKPGFLVQTVKLLQVNQSKRLDREIVLAGHAGMPARTHPDHLSKYIRKKQKSRMAKPCGF